MRAQVVRFSPLPPTHDFAITENHLVFLFPAMCLDKERFAEGTSFAESCKWVPSLGMRVLTIDKRDWSEKRYDLPAGCLFHIANAWEDAHGTVHLHYMKSENPLPLLAGWTIMAGEYRHSGPRLTELVLNPATGTAIQSLVTATEAEFPNVEATLVGRRYRNVVCLMRSDGRPSSVPGYDQVALVDVENGNTQAFKYGDDWLVEEHLFADSPGVVHSRWVVGTALDLQSKQTVLSVFDADHLQDGPIARARLPYSLPIGLHGSFQSRL